MKKIILGAFALLTFGFSQAQIKFGAKAGVNLANITESYNGYDSDFTSDYKAKVGFNVGGFVEFKLSEKFALAPEVVFSTQGAKYEETTTDNGFGETSHFESKINLGYINVPVMVKFYPIPKLFVEAGPQVGFLVSAKSKNEGTDTFLNVDDQLVTVSQSETVDVKDGYKSIDFGVNVGVGYEFTEMIYADLRYNIGLSDISKTDDGLEGFDFGVLGDLYKTKNNVLSLSVGFKF